MLIQNNDSNLPVTEIKILWGDSLLHVSHLDQSKNFYISNTDTSNDDTRFIVGPNILGNLKEVPVILANKSETKFVFLPNAIGQLKTNNSIISLENLILSNQATPSSTIPDAYEIIMEPETSYAMQIGNLTVVASKVNQGRKTPYTFTYDQSLINANIGSALAVLTAILTTHLLTKDNNNYLTQSSEDDRLSELRAFIQRQQERQLEEPQQTNDNNQEGGEVSAAHAGLSGQMGSRQAPQRNTRRAIRNNGEQPHLSRQAARDAVSNRGIFAALGSPGGSTGGASGIVSPFGAMTESGPDNQNANGNLIGDSIGDSFGYNGLGPTGPGWGGGGRDEQTIGAGPLGTIGRDGNQRYGVDRGTNLHNRDRHGPIVRPSTPNITGLLSPEAIRRVVLRNLSQVTHCHEQGLIQNPSLEGRVVVRFAIGGDGTILASNVAESTLPEPSVAQCIAGAVRRWQFPTPEGNGVVIVNYPFNLQSPE